MKKVETCNFEVNRLVVKGFKLMPEVVFKLNVTLTTLQTCVFILVVGVSSEPRWTSIWKCQKVIKIISKNKQTKQTYK